ncbi:MAG: hypothetical protein ACLUSL_06390 [Ruminococcus sp.]
MQLHSWECCCFSCSSTAAYSAKQPADKGSYSYYYAEPDAANAESTTEADNAIPFYQNVK